MSIMKNAIDSIQIGVEDFESGDERRYISAVRNIVAGILLLYKVKLCQLSPDESKELLIKKFIFPKQDADGEIFFVGKGKNTVDVQSIKDRFKSLGIVVDWEKFKVINDLRTDIEHYYTLKTSDAVREIIASSFILIRDFLSQHLEQDPQEALGNDCWSKLLEVSEVYDAEVIACKTTLNAIDWNYRSVRKALDYLRCVECNSSLIQAPYPDDSYPYINLHCKSCGHDFVFTDVVEECINKLFELEDYSNALDGCSSPSRECNQCFQSTYVHEEDCCVVCGYTMEYRKCEICGESLSLEEQENEGKCSYCQYKFEKMMAED